LRIPQSRKDQHVLTIANQIDTIQSIDPDVVDEFRSQLGGQLLAPGEPAYEQARQLWNGMIDQRPAIIVQPTGVSDVIHAIRFARENDFEISIKGGGHNVAGLATTNGGLMLDLEFMRGVRIDPQRRTARVAGGARWADFDREAGVFGLATTGGAISTTGVAGLTLGGGIGWLVGKHGLAIDNLISVDVVTAAGELVTASNESHPDLFWALRGGGGNFGVATSFEFQLYPLDMVYAGMVAYPPDSARDVLEFYREFTATAPDELTVYATLTAEPEQGQRIAALAFCWSGDMDQAEAVLAPLFAFGSPVMTMAGPMPYAAWNAANDILFPHGLRYYWKSALLRNLDDAVLDAAARYGANPELPLLNVTFEHYAGVMNRRDASETAFPHRDARYQAVIIGRWEDAADDETGKAWARGLHAAIEPYGLKGDFLNFATQEGNERRQRTRAGYGPNWERLVEIKRRYDPDNVFHRNHNITP
jgi:FAD/FMN-containing dehydrogenase